MQATGQFMKRYDGELDKDRIIRAVNSVLRIVRDQQVSGDVKTHPRLKQINQGVGEYFQKQGHRLWQYDIPPGNESRLLYARSNSGEITLLDYSLTHDVLGDWNNYKNPEVISALTSSKQAPRILSDLPAGWDESPLAVSKIGDTPLLSQSAQFEEEWLAYLDLTQLKTRNKLLHEILANRNHQVHFILGPAGSGKTVVLTELARELWDSTGDTAELSVPKGVEDYLRSAYSIIPGLGKATTPSKCAILLDDPITFDYFLLVLEKARSKNLPLVVSIDPVQWAERDTLIEFAKYLDENPTVKIHELKVVYRQAENVGRPALQVLEAFLQKTARHTDSYKDLKVKQKITPITDISIQNVKFAIPQGSYKVLEPVNWMNLVELFIDELVQCGKFESIKSWPQLLIGTPIKDKLPAGFPDSIEEMKILWEEKISTSKFNAHTRSFDQLELVRGSEYENVLILMESHHWQDLQDGVKNTTAKTWDELATPLTFLTRAINRCTILLLPDDMSQKRFVERRQLGEDPKFAQFIRERVSAEWLKHVGS